jgi:hypothetical protein
MRACYDGDTYISLPGNFKWMDQVVGEEIFILILGADVLKITLILGGFAKIFLLLDKKPKVL